jgi:replicative DNA helicase
MYVEREMNKTIRYEIEQSVIGGLLIDGSNLPEIALVLKPDHFNISKFRQVYEAMLKMADDGKPIDILLLVDEVKNLAPALAPVAEELLWKAMHFVPSAANTLHYAHKLIDYTNLTKVYEALQGPMNASTLEHANYRDVFQQVAEMRDILPPPPAESVSMKESLDEFMDYLENPSEKHLVGTPLSFDIPSLDEHITDVGPGRIMTIGGRTSQGKSTLAVKLIRQMLLMDQSVLLLTFEMERRAFLIRLAAQMASEMAGIPIQKIANPKTLNEKDLSTLKSIKLFLESVADRFWIYESPSMEEVYTLIRQHQPDVFVVDYLQAMIYKEGSGDDKYRGLTNGFMCNAKDLALKYKCRGVILSQLKRIQQESRRPRLTDMLESSAIENHSDVVILAWWPSKEGGECPEEDVYKKRNPRVDCMKVTAKKFPHVRIHPDDAYYEIIIDKNRNGATPVVPCTIIPLTTEIYDNKEADKIYDHVVEEKTVFHG